MISDILGFSMEAHGDPMGPHGTPWGPHGAMGTHGNPWIFHGFSMNFRGGRGSGRQKIWGGVGEAGAPPTNSLGRPHIGPHGSNVRGNQ